MEELVESTLAARAVFVISKALSMMPATGPLVARKSPERTANTTTLLRQKALTFWRLRDGRHYNAALSESLRNTDSGSVSV
jgi:hypothetical protein